METIRIPLYKDPVFEIEFKKYLLHQINKLYLEYGEIPNEVSFRGKLGKHLHTLVVSNNWNFNKTKMIHEKGPNEMEIRFTRNIIVKKNSNIAPSHQDSLDGRIVNGWLDSKAVSSLTGSSNLSFDVEKTETPSVTVLIKELK